MGVEFPSFRRFLAVLSARHVQNGIGNLRLLGQRLDGFVRGENHQFDFAAASLDLYPIHHRKRAIVSRAYYKRSHFHGISSSTENRSVSEFPTEFLRGFFLRL